MPEFEAWRPDMIDMTAHGVTVVEAVEYGVGSGEPLLLDYFYLPETPAPRPVIVWIHGGGFTEEHVTRLARPETRFLQLMQRGYMVVSIDYRLAQVEPFPSQIIDCKSAICWLKANAEKLEIDPKRIAVWGESCGGQLAGLMAVKEGIPGFEPEADYGNVDSSIAAAVSWYGGFNIAKFTSMQADPRFLVMYGGSFEEKRELVEKASPINYVDRDLCPLLAMCSNTDHRVPDSQSLEYCQAAAAHGNISEFIMVPGQGHGYFEGDEYYEQIYAFFDKYLK